MPALWFRIKPQPSAPHSVGFPFQLSGTGYFTIGWAVLKVILALMAIIVPRFGSVVGTTDDSR